jgi:trehalose utilization protein
MADPIRVTVWNEFVHEQRDESVMKIYPDGMHTLIGNYLREQGHTVQYATQDQPEHGLTQDVLDNTDVMTWWGHCAHGDVSDEIVERVYERVLAGMGLIALHSSHFAKIFKKLMGTSCTLQWRSDGERERIWVVEPSHPIAQGLGDYFELPQVEMYGERFDVPDPETLVFISWFQGGEVFRSGMTYRRGNGKIFYFRPGDQEYPIYHDQNVLKVIDNAVRWAAPTPGVTAPKIVNAKEAPEKF